MKPSEAADRNVATLTEEPLNMNSTLIGEVRTIDGTVLDVLFSRLVERNPNKVILEHGDRTMTFGELDRRSSQLAHYLQSSFDVVPGDIVALLVTRSFDMMVSIMAILKCGAAYVPLETSIPHERIKYILEDCKPKAVITSIRNNQLMEGYIDLPGISPDLDKLPTVFDRGSIDPRALAYVIYTSGSTGKPKGVMIEHQSVVNRLQWMWETYQFSQDDVILQKTPYVFDVSVWEIFLPLCFGARMVLCDRDDVGDPARIVSLIGEHKVTSVHFVPGMYNVFLSYCEALQPGQLDCLRHVFCSGEALLPKTAEQHHVVFDIPLFNLYGPTEATVDVSFFEVMGNEKGNVPIGKPVWNTDLHILDENLNPIPKGSMGELYIGGIQLARQYVDVSLGKDRFITHPRLGRLYKTGDQALVNKDDQIEFHGRNDHQVKIRGFRIELGEIESAMLNHDAIDLAVVEARQDQVHGSKLIGYYRTKPDHDLSEDELVKFLNHWLPEYMIPYRFVLIGSIPLTVNGKIDRKQLFELDQSFEMTDRNELHEMSPLEQRVAKIWISVLNVPDISIDQNFFKLGGDSLNAIKLMNAINSEFSISLPMKTVFNHPTIRDIAKVVEEVDISYDAILL